MKGGELRLLHQPFALIGRDSRADLVLNHSRVSRRHLYFQVIEGRGFWVDLESRTGTRVGGEVQKYGWLRKGGAPLCIGPFVIRQLIEGGQSTKDPSEDHLLPDVPFVAAAYSNKPLPEVALEFLNGPSQATTWPVRRVMSFIGSASGCKFRLTDASVSRFHASFLRTSTGLWIVDLLGQGGVIVNDVSVRFSPLADGDLLRIGRYDIRVQCRVGRPGSGSNLLDRAGVKAAGQSRPRERLFNGLKSADWSAASLPSMPGTELAKTTQFPLAISPIPSDAKSEMVPLEAAFTHPIGLSSSESNELMLMPLVNQFGLMQQQMFDQFQQAMMMMLQMFGTMHRDQMEVIRRELDQLHELTEEFQSLKNELANRHPEVNQSTSNGNGIASEGLDELMAREETFFGKPAASDAPMKVSPDPEAPASTTSQATSPAATFPEGKQPVIEPGELSSPQAPKVPVSTVAPSSERGELHSSSSEKTDVTNTAANSDRESIVWLHQRIMTLQRERETRWQKILKLLPGSS